MKLDWNPSIDSGISGLKGYTIYKNDVFLKKISAPELTTIAGGLIKNYPYIFGVSAIDNANNISATTTANITTLDC